MMKELEFSKYPSANKGKEFECSCVVVDNLRHTFALVANKIFEKMHTKFIIIKTFYFFLGLNENACHSRMLALRRGGARNGCRINAWEGDDLHRLLHQPEISRCSTVWAPVRLQRLLGSAKGVSHMSREDFDVDARPRCLKLPGVTCVLVK